MFKYGVELIDSILMNGMWIIIPEELQKQALEWHINHMGIGKQTRLLACESFYWIYMNANIENIVKKLFYMWWFSADAAQRKKHLSWNIGNMRETNWNRHVFSVQKHYLCIKHYHRKFPVIKERETLSADSLILACNGLFSEYGLPNRIVAEVDDNFASEKFK